MGPIGTGAANVKGKEYGCVLGPQDKEQQS